jgi:hypothetical protein
MIILDRYETAKELLGNRAAIYSSRQVIKICRRLMLTGLEAASSLCGRSYGLGFRNLLYPLW